MLNHEADHAKIAEYLAFLERENGPKCADLF
jgi:hypothetical protein